MKVIAVILAHFVKTYRAAVLRSPVSTPQQDTRYPQSGNSTERRNPIGRLAPAGKTGLIVSLLLDYELVRRIRDDGWYDEFETAMEDRIIGVLADSIYPDLKETVLFKFSASPLAIEERVRSSDGAIVGWSFEKPLPIDSSILSMKDSVRTALPDIMKVGQWAASPAGIPTCILTAKLAADLTYKECGPN